MNSFEEMQKTIEEYLAEVLAEAGFSWKYKVSEIEALTEAEIENPRLRKGRPIIMSIGRPDLKLLPYGCRVTFTDPPGKRGPNPLFFDIHPIESPTEEALKHFLKAGLFDISIAYVIP